MRPGDGWGYCAFPIPRQTVFIGNPQDADRLCKTIASLDTLLRLRNTMPRMSSIREELLAEIEAFLAKQKMAPAKFGQKAVGDMGFVLRLRAGRDIRIGTADRARKFMRSYKPSEEAKAQRKARPSLRTAA